MSFVVRRVGGGTFNPHTLCFSPDDRFLFVACGPIITIYQVPDLTFFDHRSSHKSDVVALTCSAHSLISGDRNGVILFHNFNEITGVDKAPSRVIEHTEPIEKLFVRQDKVFFVFYRQKLFWFVELDSPNSLFLISHNLQKQLCDLREHQNANVPTWLRFPALDAFDVDESGNVVVVGDECKVHIYDFATQTKSDHNMYQPARICRFRGSDVCIFTQSGSLHQIGARPFKDHWHFVCPNSMVADSTTVYSGGFEGVLIVWRQALNRHSFMPRLGMTIEALALTSNFAFIAAVVDKNMLAMIDCGVLTVRHFVSHPFGDVFFSQQSLVSIRRPNLIQFFDSKSGQLTNQLLVSSYNSTVPVTAVDLSETYLVTVETSGGNPPPELTMAQQSEYNHIVPHGNLEVAKASYLAMLTQRRREEMLQMMKLRYVARSAGEAAVEETPLTIEGNPLVHDRQPHNPVSYSELKIWSKSSQSYEIEQSFRIIGKPVNALRLHPQFAIFAVAVERELQFWKLSTKWQLWKSATLREIPQTCFWSPDGSILVIQFANRLAFFDIEIGDVIADKQFNCGIVSATFARDIEIVVSLENGVACFDVRSFSVSTHYFARPDCIAACSVGFAFAVNGSQPCIVLSAGGDMKSWQLPTVKRICAIHITTDKTGIRISAVDEANFIWSVDEYGAIEEREVRLTTIAPARVEKREPREKVAVKLDRTREILDLLSFPSHQIPKIGELCPALFAILIDPPLQTEVTSTVIPQLEEDIVDEEIDALTLAAPELARLRAILV
jgi:hypothetical protein